MSHKAYVSLHWRHNERDSVSNHQPHDCLLNRLFRRRSKKTSKLRVTGLCVGKSPGPVNSPHKWPVTRKMFPFDDVIMVSQGVLRRKKGIYMHKDPVNSHTLLTKQTTSQKCRHILKAFSCSGVFIFLYLTHASRGRHVFSQNKLFKLIVTKIFVAKIIWFIFHRCLLLRCWVAISEPLFTSCFDTNLAWRIPELFTGDNFKCLYKSFIRPVVPFTNGCMIKNLALILTVA